MGWHSPVFLVEEGKAMQIQVWATCQHHVSSKQMNKQADTSNNENGDIILGKTFEGL